MVQPMNLVNMGTLTPHVLAYIGGRQRRGELAPITVRTIRNHLWRFDASHGRRPVTQLGPAAIARFLERLHDEGLADSTRAAHLSTVRGFCRWMVAERIIDRDPTIGAPRIRRPRHVPRDMTPQHVAATLDACTTNRERLVVWLMFGGGLRCVEISRLNCDDLDPITRYLHVTGKAGHERHVPLPPVVINAWHTYLDETGHRTGPVIRRETDGHGPISPERISGIAGRLVRDAGIKVRPHDGRSAHGFRAAAAFDLFDACGDARTVQEFLGHANLATTSGYLRRMHTDAVAHAQAARQLGHAA